MARLNLYLLGTPRVELDGKAVDLSRRKVLALLIHLAMTRQTQRRDGLATLFWSQSGQAAARASLRRELHTLTNAIGEGWIASDREHVALADHAAIWLDVDAFREQINAYSHHCHTADQACDACLESLHTAVALYQGDFLSGFTLFDSPEFDDWQFFHAESLRRDLANALDALVRLHGGRGEYDRAITYARRWLLLDALHEPAHRELIKLYALSGQQGAALRQYQECTRLLAEELGVEPEAETTSLFEAIRTRRWSHPSLAGAPTAPPPIDSAIPPQATLHPPEKAQGVPTERFPSVVSDLAANPPLVPTVKATSTIGRSEELHPFYNLPSPLTAFVGRQTEVEAVTQLLTQHRLLTLIGSGGIGKTRLALQVAEEMQGLFKDGVCFVNLAPVNEASLVANTIAHALALTESLDTPMIALLESALRHKQLLLVLDNFEHLIEAAPLVADLLAVARHLTVLVTSREVLSLYGEQEYAVPALQLPDSEWFATDPPVASTLFTSEALQLFEGCARAVYPDFRLTVENVRAVASICLRLDGLPLAIELAAAYVKLLSPQAMLTQLDSLWLEMTRSSRNIPARQQTLRNTIEWSYRFLNEEERRLFAQLGVFRGGCTLEAIEAICDSHATGFLLEHLGGLVNKSLVWRREDENAQPRFGMLETIREYALISLQASNEVETLQERHARYYTGYSSQAQTKLLSISQRLVLNQLASEVDNFRVALRWALEHDPELGLRMIGDLGVSWRIRGSLSETMAWAQQLLAAGRQVSTAVQARAYASTALFAMVLGQRSLGRQMAEQAYLLSQQVTDPQTKAQALHTLVNTSIAPNLSSTVYEEMILQLNEAARLYAEIENWLGQARILNLLGEVKRMQQQYEAARRYYEESVQGLRAVGYQSGVAVGLSNLGWTAFHLGKYPAALAYFSESKKLSYELDYPHNLAMSLIGEAGVLTRLQHPQIATQLLGAADAIRQSIDIVMVAADEPDYQRTIAEVQSQLGQADFDQYWQAGQKLTVSEAATLVHEFYINRRS